MWQSVESNNCHLSPTIWSVFLQLILTPTAHVAAIKVTSHLDKYPNADILWCQVRPLERILAGPLFIPL